MTKWHKRKEVVALALLAVVMLGAAPWFAPSIDAAGALTLDGIVAAFAAVLRALMPDAWSGYRD